MLLLHIFDYLRIFRPNKPKRSFLFRSFWSAWIAHENQFDWDTSLIYFSSWYHLDEVVKIVFLFLLDKIKFPLRWQENEDQNRILGTDPSRRCILHKCRLSRLMIVYPSARKIRKGDYFILRVCKKWKKLLPLCLFSSI